MDRVARQVGQLDGSGSVTRVARLSRRTVACARPVSRGGRLTSPGRSAPLSIRLIDAVEGASQSQPDDALRDAAVTRLRKKRDFGMHALIYLLVNGFLVVI